MRKTLLALAFAAASLFFAASAIAGEATNVVKSKQRELFAVVAKPKSSSRQAKLRKLFDQMLAYDVMARGSLGKQWDKRTAAEKKKFSELLTQLVRNNYKRNLEKMLAYDIRYVGEESENGSILVQTRAKHKTKAREPELEIDFRLSEVDGKLQVIDIYTERASLVKTYRSQFLRILRKDGFDKLIEKMEKKLEKMEEG